MTTAMPTTPIATAALTSGSPTSALRTVLLVDGAGTAALGVAAVLAATPLAAHLGTPGVLRGAGVLLVVVGVDMLLARRLRGRALQRAARALGAADLLFAAAVVTALAGPGGTTTLGTALAVGVVTTCVGMGSAKLALARRISSDAAAAGR
jgi:hypothetical protein